jgi:hypothetical protein
VSGVTGGSGGAGGAPRRIHAEALAAEGATGAPAEGLTDDGRESKRASTRHSQQRATRSDQTRLLTSDPDAAEAAPEDNTPPLAAGKERILSKNEAYNQARAADGRVGVRLGNDMSYRITGN